MTQGPDTRLDRRPEEAPDSGRPLQAWLVATLLLALPLAAAYSIETINDYVGARLESRVLLVDMGADATELHMALHEALYDEEVSSETRETMDNGRREMTETLPEFERLNPRDGSIWGIRKAFEVYEEAVENAFGLVEAGSLGEASVADEERAEPVFEELDRAIDDATDAYEDSARRAELAADWITYATILLGAGVLAAASERYRRGLRAKQEALERSESRFRHRALHDPLTGLPNRAFLSDRARHALERAGRSGKAVGVLWLDLDDFKHVNDSLGHVAGDEALVEAARRFERSLRAEDTVARFGGDEFVVLMEDIAGAKDTIRLAERIIDGLREPLVVAGREVPLGASIGMAHGHPDGGLVGAEDLLRDADAAMYAVKHGGKAGYRSFDPKSMKRGGRSPPEA